MNPTDILLSIAIVGIYTLVYVYLRHNYKSNKMIIKLFSEGFVYATAITGILYYLIKHIASQYMKKLLEIVVPGFLLSVTAYGAQQTKARYEKI